MSILDLPNELLDFISECLGSESDINAFAQVNHHLYRLLNQYLYRHNVQQSGSSALVWAAKVGQEETAKKLLGEITKGQNMVDFLMKPLCEAAENGHSGLVLLLLENGADLNATSKICKYGNALQSACSGMRDNTDMARLLISRGANVNQEGGFFGNALQAAVESGHEQIAKLLLENGSKVDAEENQRYSESASTLVCSSPLYAASEKGYASLVKLLLEHGSDANLECGLYGTPLAAAIGMGHDDIVEIMLNHENMVLNEPFVYTGSGSGNSDLTSVLYLASEEGNIHVLKLLLDRGADVNLQVDRWGNALTAASTMGHVEVVKLLLERGADANFRNEYCSGTLEAAAQYGHEEIVEMLIEAGADVQEAVDGARERIDHQDGEETLKLLLEASSNLSKASDC